MDLSYKESKHIALIWLIVNDAMETRDSCYITYAPPANHLYLTPDSGDGNSAVRMNMTGTGILENSQCKLYATGSTVVAEGSRIKLRLHATRKPTYQTAKRIWAAIQYDDGTIATWHEAGFWR